MMIGAGWAALCNYTDSSLTKFRFHTEKNVWNETLALASEPQNVELCTNRSQ